jgi:hypothetical protein
VKPPNRATCFVSEVIVSGGAIASIAETFATRWITSFEVSMGMRFSRS